MPTPTEALEFLRKSGVQPAFAPQGQQPGAQASPEASQALERLRSQGVVPAFGSSQSTLPVPPEPTGDGRVPVLGDVLKPFAEAGLSYLAPYRAVSGALTGGLEGARKAVEPVDLPIVGKTSPMGSVTPQEALTGPGVEKFTRDTVGNALQMAPYFLPFPGAASAASLPSKMLAGAKMGAVSGAMGSGGRSVREGGSAGDVAASSLVGGVGGAVTGAVLPAVGVGVKKVSSALTGVPEDVYTRSIDNPELHQYAKNVVAENPEAPYSAMAERAAGKLMGDKNAATAAWKKAAADFAKANPGAKFDVSAGAQDIADSLSDFGIAAKTVKGRTVLSQEGPKAISDRALGKIQEFVDEVQSSKALTPEQLIRLRQSFNRIYNELPTSELGGPTAAHAAMMKLKEPLNSVLDDVLPAPLKAADAALRAWYDSMDKFGTRIMDAQGNVNQNAGSFLRGVTGREKTVWQDRLGDELVDRLQAIKDALVLSNVKPIQGSRTTDIVKTAIPYMLGIGAASSGAGAAGTIPFFAALAGMSPAVAEKFVSMVGQGAKSGLNQAVKAGVVQSAAPSVGEGILTKARKAILGK